jgi:hypothetical protein
MLRLLLTLQHRLIGSWLLVVAVEEMMVLVVTQQVAVEVLVALETEPAHL